MNTYPTINLKAITTDVKSNGIYFAQLNCVKKDEKEKNLPFYYENIGCNLIEFVQIDREYSLVVDEEGLLKSGNPAWEITLKKSLKPVHVVGRFILVKDIETDDGMISVGFADENEAMQHYSKLIDSIQLIGFVR